MKNTQTIVFVVFSIVYYFLPTAAAHPPSDSISSNATYLGNEGIMISGRDTKLLFDPFFHKDFGIYQSVPAEILIGLNKGIAPYDKIDYVFISHAHDDHFSAPSVIKYMSRHAKVRLIAPKQAVDSIVSLTNNEGILSRITSVDLAFGQEVQRIITDNIIVEAVRIAHAGWPQRKNIQNIVFRVEIKDDVTVMHLGDADSNSIHFSPYQKHWSSKITDTAFPPYWFYLSEQGKELIETTLNTKSSIGIHVPKKIPKNLVESDKVFFHLPGETAVVLEANRNQK